MKQKFLITLVVITSGLFIFSAKLTYDKYINYPMQMNFCNEEVPLQMVDVQERLDREMLINANLDATTVLLIKRANKVFPIIEPILQKNNIPDDFKYLAVIESGLVNAVSPSGAKGVWQFMPETAREKGMEVNELIDELYHLEKSTEAACQYLRKAKEKFGTWTLAAASYNAGMAGITKQVEFQQVTNYYDLLLNEETSRYVFRILALKEIMQNPEKYGFNIPKEALYKNIPTKTLTIDTTINNLATFAKEQGFNYKILKYHNPWLRDKKIEVKTNKTYEIKLPIEPQN
jgi:hypothetical protein